MEDKIICRICGEKFDKMLQFTAHLQHYHKEYTTKTYYDKFLNNNEGYCKICNKPTKFISLGKGYNVYCCKKCAWKDTDILKKRSETISLKTQEELLNWRLKNIESHKNKLTGKYISEKEAKIRQQASENSFKEYFTKCNCEFLKYDYENKRSVTFKCNICGNETTYVRSLIDRMARNKDYSICHFCHNHKSISYPEKELKNYIKSLNPGNIILNDRSLLNGKELDIVLKDKKIAIEMDGLYWHNENKVNSTYHLEKTEECEKKGYQLIHIFEDEWNQKKDIVKSRIAGLLGMNTTIGARKTICKEIDSKTSKLFLEENHIQGNCMSKWKYGLYSENELVAVMTFGYSRFKKGEIELLRYASKKGTNIIGGAGKLLSKFFKEHNVKNIVSYADRRWSTGNLYKKLGFILERKTAPSYFYIINHERRNRFEFQKHKLVAKGNNPNLTEHEIMKNLGYPRIYDCGSLRFVYTQNYE